MPNELDDETVDRPQHRPGREPVVVLSAPWHERDTRSLVERAGVPVYTPLPDTAEDLMQKYGILEEEFDVSSMVVS